MSEDSRVVGGVKEEKKMLDSARLTLRLKDIRNQRQLTLNNRAEEETRH